MTDDDLRKILEEEWSKRKPPLPMGERRLELAVAAMRRAYEAGQADDEEFGRWPSKTQAFQNETL